MIGGLIVVIISFFALPMRFLRVTAGQLRDIGAAGRVEAEEGEQLPFMSWLLVAGRIIISVVAFGILIGMALAAAAARQGVVGFLGGVLLGALIAFAFIWIAGLLLEQLSLAIVLVHNTRQMVHLLGGSTERLPGAANRPAPQADPAPRRTHCANCGAALSPGAAFCVNCGTRV